MYSDANNGISTWYIGKMYFSDVLFYALQV